jgi:hypothetical protein
MPVTFSKMPMLPVASRELMRLDRSVMAPAARTRSVSPAAVGNMPLGDVALADAVGDAAGTESSLRLFLLSRRLKLRRRRAGLPPSMSRGSGSVSPCTSWRVGARKTSLLSKIWLALALALVSSPML